MRYQWLDDEKDEIVRRYRNGRSLSELGDQFDVSPNTIRKRLREENVDIRSRPHRLNWLDDHIEEITTRYVDVEESIQTIADRYDVSSAAIKRRLQEEDVELRPTAYDIVELEFDQNQKSIVKGELLGDGCIYRRTTGSYVFRLSNTVKSHTEYVADQLPDDLFSDAHPYSVQRKSGFGDPESVRTMWIVNSRAQEFFERLNEGWYERIDDQRRKRVPDSYELDETALLHWYWGDGSLHTRASGAPRIRLATHGFSERSVEVLIGELERLGYSPCTARQHDIENGSGIAIQLGGESARTFLRRMTPRNEITEYEYKFTTDPTTSEQERPE